MAFIAEYRSILQNGYVYIQTQHIEILNKTYHVTQAGLAAFAGYLGWKLMMEEDPTPYYPLALGVITYESLGKFLRNVYTEKRFLTLFQKSLPTKTLTSLTVGSLVAYGKYYFYYQPEICEAFSNCRNHKQDQGEWIDTCRSIMKECQAILADKTSYQVWRSEFNPRCTESLDISTLENPHFYYQCDLKGQYRQRFDGLLTELIPKFCVNFFPDHRFKKAFNAPNCVTLRNISDVNDDPCARRLSDIFPTVALTPEAVNVINQIFFQLSAQFTQCKPSSQQSLPEVINQNLVKIKIMQGVTLVVLILEIEAIFHEKITQKCTQMRDRIQYRPAQEGGEIELI